MYFKWGTDRDNNILIEPVPDLQCPQLIKHGDLYLAIRDTSPFLVADDANNMEELTDQYIDEMMELSKEMEEECE